MRILAIIRKELRQIRRDSRTLSFIIFMPALLLLVFGYVLSFDVKNIKTGVLDMDRSQHSRALIQSLAGGETFAVKTMFSRRDGINAALDNGDVSVVIVIPSGFGKKIEAGENAQIQSMLDGSNSQSATLIHGYVNGFAFTYSNKIVTNQLLAMGRDRMKAPVNIEPRLWYNPELKSSMFLIPGLMVFILMVTSTISTALSIVREKERGTIEQLLVSPLAAPEIIIGKTIPYVFIALASTAIILAVGDVAFDVSIKGSHALLLLSATLFTLCALGQGILISTITKSQQVAYMIATLSSMLPALLLSGFIFPIRNMPYAIQLVTYAIPARYFVEVLRSILLKGVGIEAYWKELLALSAFSIIVMAVASIRMARVKLG